MDEKVRVIEKNGTKIIFVDCSNLPADKIIELYPKMEELAISGKIRLFILDITSTHATPEMTAKSKESIANIEKHLGKIKTSLIGITGIQKIIANAVMKDLYMAKDIEDAASWLIAQKLL